MTSSHFFLGCVGHNFLSWQLTHARSVICLSSKCNDQESCLVQSDKCAACLCPTIHAQGLAVVWLCSHEIW
jgi:hypothetical protein